ncbi:hypothetical protein E2C01_010184 [Portunus trituberculatus]|uniref:Uncharacterized protein n=1 Tax=Portunus trituberculatus TaxID=210409 RepID=A0A5B7D7Y5_PORTR|nr:hypothetical protein [Portunus trituberculatus]
MLLNHSTLTPSTHPSLLPHPALTCLRLLRDDPELLGRPSAGRLERITAHRQDGAIKTHHATNHADTTFNSKKIEENTVILRKEPRKPTYG